MEQPFDEQIIREYLLDNPSFFNRYPELLNTIRLPHNERGTVSLVERQQQILRERVEHLEEEITALMTIARRNEEIYQRNNEISLALLKCETQSELHRTLCERLIHYFNFSHVRLIKLSSDDPLLTNIWQKRLALGHYFGRLPLAESKKLFNSDVGSVALTQLKLTQLKSNELAKTCDKYMLAIASSDAMHFNPEMDNMLLEQLQQLLIHLLPRLQKHS